MLSVQAVQGHADLVVQPLQPELYKTTASALPPPSPEGGLKAVHTVLRVISRQACHHLTQPGQVTKTPFLKPAPRTEVMAPEKIKSLKSYSTAVGHFTVCKLCVYKSSLAGEGLPSVKGKISLIFWRAALTLVSSPSSRSSRIRSTWQL